MILLRIPKFIGRKLYWRNPRETHVISKLTLKYYYVIGKKDTNERR